METSKIEIIRIYAKYIFLDVVRFSDRSAEAQSDIVKKLNDIIRQALEKHGVISDDCILIPTGDGLCIAMISPNIKYDIHIQISLSILALLDLYNKAMPNKTRQFQVRIGINQNTDILVTDINERKNIAGAGINMASRIMDKADSGQILVSQTVYDELQPSEAYMDKFESFNALGKHNLSFRVYQYNADGYPGLNCKIPTEFVQKEAPKATLSKIVAYYLAHAIKLKPFIVKKQGHGQNNYSLVILFWFLAIDSEGDSEATVISPYAPQIYGEGKLALDVVFNYYNSLDFRIVSTLAGVFIKKIREYRTCTFDSGFGVEPIFVTDEGKQKLKTEWPQIWNEFELDNVA